MDTSEFAAQRQQRVSLLKKKMFEALLEEDGGVFLAKTGSLLKGTSLRGKENRKKMAKIIETFPVPIGEDCKARFWTKRLFKDALAGLLADYPQLELPRLPGFDQKTWLQDQAKLLQQLAKKARRNSGHKSRSSWSSMDELQTLPYEAQDRLCFELLRFKRCKNSWICNTYIRVLHTKIFI